MTDHRPENAKSNLLSPQTEVELVAGMKALTFNPQEYRRFLEGVDWTETQKDEFTQALWCLIVSVVDLGFGLNPIQQFTDDTKALERDFGDMVSSDIILPTIETVTADGLPELTVARRDS